MDLQAKLILQAIKGTGPGQRFTGALKGALPDPFKPIACNIFWACWGVIPSVLRCLVVAMLLGSHWLSRSFSFLFPDMPMVYF